MIECVPGPNKRPDDILFKSVDTTITIRVNLIRNFVNYIQYIMKENLNRRK